MLGTAGGGAVTKNKNRNLVYINQSTTAPQAGCIATNLMPYQQDHLGTAISCQKGSQVAGLIHVRY